MNENLRNAIEALKKALAECDELKAYNEAKAAYNKDEELTKLITEYNVQATLLETEGQKAEEERDTDLIQTLSTRLRELYDSISENKSLIAMREAEQDLSAIVGEINSAVQLTIEPESACTHDCSTCGGCH
ncbi:MAG: YlbF family regulator [Clostridia bacterium]|nr:YlbF family regulator [Clostridia bacterium]MBR5279097.1 YlbF family regulator [Clostridia bacterium]